MKRLHCMFLKLSLDLDEGSHFSHFGLCTHHKLLFITTAADVTSSSWLSMLSLASIVGRSPDLNFIILEGPFCSTSFPSVTGV
ncbi:unnamed protein product [Gadus morhua 'NCC']